MEKLHRFSYSMQQHQLDRGSFSSAATYSPYGAGSTGGLEQQSESSLDGSLLASPRRTSSSSTLTQLNWLIDGLPEMYDDGDAEMEGGVMDDLAVEKLINEGGRPPSQLMFPSLHRMGQLIMNRLQGAKCLLVTFHHIFIYSGRYGVRKHCSRLVVRPPIGCESLLNEPEAVVLDLPELLCRGQYSADDCKDKDADITNQNNRYHQSSSSSSKIKEKNIDKVKKRSTMGVGADAFFVGEMELRRTVAFPIKDLSDATLQRWLGSQGQEGGHDSDSDSGRSCLRIDLESHVTPPYKGIFVQPNVRTRVLTCILFFDNVSNLSSNFSEYSSLHNLLFLSFQFPLPFIIINNSYSYKLSTTEI